MKFNGKEFQTSLDVEVPDHCKVKITLTREGDTERFWAGISEKDFLDYEDEVTDSKYSRIAVALNQTLGGIPWGPISPTN